MSLTPRRTPRSPRARRDPDAATAAFEQARRIAEVLSNGSLRSSIEFLAGLADAAGGRHDAAVERQTLALGLSERCGTAQVASNASTALALRAIELGADSTGLIVESIRRTYEVRNWGYVWALVEAVALHWLSEHREDDGAVLIGYLDARDLRWPSYETRRRSASAELQRTRPDAMARGVALDADELVELILGRIS